MVFLLLERSPLTHTYLESTHPTSPHSGHISEDFPQLEKTTPYISLCTPKTLPGFYHSANTFYCSTVLIKMSAFLYQTSSCFKEEPIFLSLAKVIKQIRIFSDNGSHENSTQEY
jgi:hypothetical protein